jgi:hypothetical protein
MFYRQQSVLYSSYITAHNGGRGEYLPSVRVRGGGGSKYSNKKLSATAPSDNTWSINMLLCLQSRSMTSQYYFLQTIFHKIQSTNRVHCYSIGPFGPMKGGDFSCSAGQLWASL